MAQQSERRGGKNQWQPKCSKHASVIWIWPANSHTGPQWTRCKQRPDRWQHPTKRIDPQNFACHPRGVHRWLPSLQARKSRDQGQRRRNVATDLGSSAANANCRQEAPQHFGYGARLVNGAETGRPHDAHLPPRLGVDGRSIRPGKALFGGACTCHHKISRSMREHKRPQRLGRHWPSQQKALEGITADRFQAIALLG